MEVLLELVSKDKGLEVLEWKVEKHAKEKEMRSHTTLFICHSVKQYKKRIFSYKGKHISEQNM